MKKLLITAVMVCMTIDASAQSLKIATGSTKGTYSTMLNELVAACGNDVALVNVPSGGSMDNINQLVGNQVNGALVQEDVLFFRARTEDLGNVKTLMTMHTEQVHIVALADSGIKTGGTMGFGAKPVVFSDLTSLSGHTIGASGGSVQTAQIIRLQSEVPFNVRNDFDSNDQVLAALKKGEIQAGLFVGGQPMPFIAGLGKDFKLIAINGPVAERVKGVYRPARLNYSKMNAAGIPTVQTNALFVTREYKTERMVQALSKFRACAVSKVQDLQEQTGTHPAWQSVDPSNKGKWAWMDLPETKTKK